MRRTLTVATALLLAALALSAIEGAGVHVRHDAWGKPVPWLDALLRPLPHWLSFAALAPLVILLAVRFRIGPGAWKWLPLHVAGAVAFAILHTTIGALVYRVLLRSSEPLSGVVVSQLAFDLTLETMSYVALVIGTQAYLWYDDARRARETAADARRHLAEARLALVRSRLQPHFLFNTLQAISALALKGEGEAVAVAIARLSDVLRATLDEREEREIPLARELAILDSYLEIQKLRYAERLAIERRIDATALTALVPPLLLQPIVENAFHHGIARSGRGTIRVSAFARAGWLEMSVEDDGPGPATIPPREGLGLSVTRERLRELHGARHRLTIERATGGGAQVQLAIPFRAASTPLAEDRP